MAWELGGVFEVERMANPREYTVRTPAGVVAVRVEINGDLFPSAWHAAMLRDLERRWVHRVCPPLRLVAGDSPVCLVLPPADDPYLLAAPEEKR